MHPGGLFLTEIKDHQVLGVTIPVTDWFLDEFRQQGCVIEAERKVPVRGLATDPPDPATNALTVRAAAEDTQAITSR